ncbi:Mut7-C RNAse domain-containing protein [Haloarchaeobius sp. DFWS5]|uniref:Mut7-C RNAse domain-containing protein n=1 Tax=Haloarchaeobius sp. DFWS5 TaxID=3446114 RepID=UPI003EBFB7BA
MARYLLDAMLGNLAVYLRLCGHDTVYALDRDIEADDRLLELAAAEGRVLVTRDEQLAARAAAASSRAAPGSILLRTRETEDMLRELASAGVALSPTDEPAWCGRCNGELRRVERDGTAAVPEYVPNESENHRLWRCRACGQYFWKGGHWDRMVATLDRAREC